MRYPKPTDKYSCEVLCENFMEIDERLNEHTTEIGRLGGQIVSSKSGESIVTTDSANTPLVGMKVFGKSWQNTDPVNQLFTFATNIKTNGYITKNGITATLTEDGNVVINGTSTSVVTITLGSAELTMGETYTLSCNSLLSIAIWDSTTSTQISSGSTKITFTAKSSGNHDVIIITTQGTTFNNVLGNLTLVSGSTGLSWESYVSGVNIPSPEYPQDIHSHGENGNIVQSLFGSNLIDWYGNLKSTINGVSTSIQSDGGIKVVGTNTVGYSQIVRTTKTLPAGTYFISGGECVPNNVYTQVSFKNEVTGSTVYNINQSFTLTQPTSITVTLLTHGTTGQTIDTVIYPMLNVGAEQAKFDPYINEQTLTLQTPNGLHGVKVSSGGNYTDADGQQWLCDEIDLERGKHIQRVAQTLLTACEYFDATNKIAYGNLVYYPERGKSFFGSISNKLVEDINFWTNRTVGTYTMRTTSTADWLDYMRVLIFVPSEITSKAEATAWLVEQEIYILHQLYEPIETDLTEEEIAQYKSSLMNYPITTIINDAGAYTEIEYASDTQKHIEQNYVPVSEFNSALERISALEQNAINS